MKSVKAAIEVADEKLDAAELRAYVEMELGVRTVIKAEYADAMILVTPEPMVFGEEEVLPPVRLDALRSALEAFGVTVTPMSTLKNAFSKGEHAETVSALKELRALFREFKSNPLSKVELRGRDPKDPEKREVREAARKLKDDFYQVKLAGFIAEHPSLPARIFWAADHRPYGGPEHKQWPEYWMAVRKAKEMK